MKFIVLQGLPGSGKTSIAKKLCNFLDNVLCVEVDKFKREALREGKSWERSKNVSYEKTLALLYECLENGAEYVVLDELFVDDCFVNGLKNFSDRNNAQCYWFIVERSFEELLEVESRRKRKVKNSLEDFVSLKKLMDDCMFEGRIVLKNSKSYDVDVLVKKILEKLV